MITRSLCKAVSLAVFCYFLTLTTILGSAMRCPSNKICPPVNGVQQVCDPDNQCRPTQVKSCGNENGTCCPPHVLAQGYICAGRLVCAYNECTDLVKSLNLIEFCTVTTSLDFCLSDLDCAVTATCNRADYSCHPTTFKLF